jgi:hypothetical protein
MNGYYIQTNIIEVDEPVHGHGECLGYVKEDWADARLVYAETRSKARYMFWQQVIKPATGEDFDESLLSDTFKSITLIVKNSDHIVGVFAVDDEEWFPDDNWCSDYNLIPDPIWRKIVLRFWTPISQKSESAD